MTRSKGILQGERMKIAKVIALGLVCLASSAGAAFCKQNDVVCPADFDRQNSDTLDIPGAYFDMPYMVDLPSGALGMVITRGDQAEGSDTQRISWLRSEDDGVTWSLQHDIEGKRGPEASWGMPFMFDGRLHVVYVFNTKDIRRWPLSGGGSRSRVDSLGDILIRSSSDEGKTWSGRTTIKVPLSEIDRRNGWGGRERALWLSGAPKVINGYVYIGFSKVGRSVSGDIFPDTESFLLRSSNPSDGNAWELLPSDDQGFTFGGDVTEEPNIGVDAEGGIIVTSRTNQGKIWQSRSTDNGATWYSSWATYSDGREVASPRANAPMITLPDGQLALWHHNNDHRGFQKRNPVFVSCAEKLGVNGPTWSAPRLLICDSDDSVRISYPSFMLRDDTLLIAETSKTEVRLHRVAARSICSE